MYTCTHIYCYFHIHLYSNNIRTHIHTTIYIVFMYATSRLYKFSVYTRAKLMRILNLSQHLTNLSSLTSTLFALFHQFPPKSPSFPFLMKMNSFKTLPYNNKMRKCPLCLVVHLLQPDPPKSIDSLSKRIEMRTRPCVHWYFMYTCTPR